MRQIIIFLLNIHKQAITVTLFMVQFITFLLDKNKFLKKILVFLSYLY